MENLNLEETPPLGGPPVPSLGAGLPQQNQQLPPQMFTTAAQLLDMTDSKDSDSMAVLYGGRRASYVQLSCVTRS